MLKFDLRILIHMYITDVKVELGYYS